MARAGRTGVAAIGVAQEFRWVFTGTTYHADEGGGGRILRQNLTDKVASRRVIETNGRVDGVPLRHTTP
ncbi:MAG: hypothetical protein ACRDQ9_11590 [Pseudonocardiaceae bacterium]